MTGKTFRVITLVITVTVLIAAGTTVIVFNTSFIRNTIDYFSFFAGIFLMIDGFYKIRRYASEPYFPNQLIRHMRIIFGTCIFTIHCMQYLYGV